MYNFTQLGKTVKPSTSSWTKNNFSSKFLKSITSFGVVMLFLFGGNFVYSQTVTLETTVIVNFGIDADVEADVLTFWPAPMLNPQDGTDDWFDFNDGQSGRGVIAIPTGLKATDLYSGGNVAVRLGMSEVGPYVDPDLRTWLDALYARDQRTNGGFKDGTVFGGTSNKNFHNPTTWTIKTGADCL